MGARLGTTHSAWRWLLMESAMLMRLFNVNTAYARAMEEITDPGVTTTALQQYFATFTGIVIFDSSSLYLLLDFENQY